MQLEECKDELWASQHSKATLERKLVACHVSLRDAEARSVALEAAAPVAAARIVAQSVHLVLAVFAPSAPPAGLDQIKQVCLHAAQCCRYRLHASNPIGLAAVFSSQASRAI